MIQAFPAFAAFRVHRMSADPPAAKDHAATDNSPAATAMPPDVRPVVYSGAALTLDLLRLYSTALRLDADSIWILLYVIQQSMGEFLLDPEQARAWARAPIVDDAVRGWVSRRAVAEATGLPRETVRRKMANLAEKGLIIEDASGCIRVRNDGWEQQGLEDFVRDFQACVERHRQRCARITDYVREPL